MNIEYELTVEDDLNARYTNFVLWKKEGRFSFISTRYFPLAISIVSVGVIVWSFFIPELADRSALFSLGVLYLFISVVWLFFLEKPQQFLSWLK